ncbi:methionine ABC transporter ATP-binding protein [Clostridium sp. P21]|uniref:Methionine ABC transporter ATP-binding protein n=1 Tax=Clostridium muellerianum TaxID=2716538 RepID=A0A7Y0ELJ0_9CLOT|nr:methionine ABC transporter ATP-binding protein [Clostridium muellerianum]NMM64615.1 methionine ABC transporter ATP-binding protein [Clostridium muellerianum]
MIKLENVNKSFSHNQVLKNINLRVEKGDIIGIVGHSGAGKSTLLRCLNALETYDSGNVTIMGKELKGLKEKEIKTIRKKLGMIFQNFNLLNRKDVFDNIALPLQVWNFDKAYVEKKVTNLVKLVGLEDKIHSMPKDLSGGQKQRVGIARALALDPEILLCDEATSALDPNTTKSILELIKKINEELNITVVLVTHQMEVVKEICNRVALMEKGEIKGQGTVEELFLKPDKSLQKLLGENEIIPETGVNIKIFFPKEYSQQCIITSIARELDIDFSIVWGKLEKFRDNVLGSLVINTNEKHKESICKFLDSKSIIWEVIESDV